VTPLITCLCLTTSPGRLHLLPDALRSYRQQTYRPRELLVVNDGSPLSSRAPDVRVVNLPERGSPWTIGEKRNVGIRAANGDYLATWDDDDVSLPHRLQQQMHALSSWGSVCVVVDQMFVSDKNLRLLGLCSRGWLKAVMASALVSRNAMVSAGGYSVTNYMEDAEMLERIRYLHRGRVATIRDARFYVLRRHDANVTLLAGETADEYAQCALRNPSVNSAQYAVDAVHSGPGGDDVIASA
jgi:glycosyltransferase involved in cell wall biosynthesis